MIPINRVCISLLLAALLVISAGCIANQPQANTSSSPAPEVVATPAVNQGVFADHGSFNVLRGEPFTITGTVPDRTMTTVQVWMLNRSVSTELLPVNRTGTFSVTLDAGVTLALGRNFTSAIIAQYPGPARSFRGKLRPGIPGDRWIHIVPDKILKEVNDRQYYPTTQENFLCQAIDSPAQITRVP